MDVEVKEKKRKPTYEDLVELLPKRVSLHFVDYNSSFDNNSDELNQCLQTGQYDALYDVINEWESDESWESCQEILKQLKIDACSAGFKKKKVKQLIEEFNDDLRSTIEGRDDSDILKDMLRNTSNLVAVYSLGLDVPETWYSAANRRLYRMAIKKALQITDSRYDKEIEELLGNASYGGELSIFFNADVEDFILPGEGKEFTTIQFTNPCVALPHYGNGSGHDVFLKGHSFKVPFKRGNLFLDKSMKYNYTYAVCGMSSDWCSATDVELSIEEVEPESLPDLGESSSASIRNSDAEYDRIYKSGKCSFGDMDMRRHRGVFYINDFPCGNKCPHCGTFWID